MSSSSSGLQEPQGATYSPAYCCSLGSAPTGTRVSSRCRTELTPENFRALADKGYDGIS